MALTTHLAKVGEDLDAKIKKSLEHHNPNTPYVIADFGCAGCANSLLFMDFVIDSATKIVPGLNFQLLFEDLPDNDFSVAAKAVNEHYKDRPNVFPSFVGRSMYEQISPDSSINCSGCFTAMHWMSRFPGPFPGRFHGEEDNKEWADQAHSDLVNFFKVRTKELRPGGVLFTSLCAPNMTRDIYNVFQKTLAKALEREGVAEYYDGYTAPAQYLRTQAEVMLALKEVGVEELATVTTGPLKFPFPKGMQITEEIKNTICSAMVKSGLSVYENPVKERIQERRTTLINEGVLTEESVTPEKIIEQWEIVQVENAKNYFEKEHQEEGGMDYNLILLQK